MGFIIGVNRRFMKFSDGKDMGSDAIIVEEKSKATVFPDSFKQDAEILIQALGEKGIKYNLVSGPFEIKDLTIIDI